MQIRNPIEQELFQGVYGLKTPNKGFITSLESQKIKSLYTVYSGSQESSSDGKKEALLVRGDTFGLLNLQSEPQDKDQFEDDIGNLTLIQAKTVQNSEMKTNQTVTKDLLTNQDLVETQRRRSTFPSGNSLFLQNLREYKGSAEAEFLALESLQQELLENHEEEFNKLIGEYQNELSQVREASRKTLMPN